MSKDKNEKTQCIIQYLKQKHIHVDFYPGCNEPGYDDQPVIASNWNDIDEKWDYHNIHEHWNKINDQLFDYVKSIGCSAEWDDEWTDCMHCHKAIRNQGNSYNWLPSYVRLVDGNLCHTCLDENMDEWFDDIITEHKNNPTTALTETKYVKALEQYGFECLDNESGCTIYESGVLHEYQNDKPEKICKEMQDKGFDVVFVINNQSQFTTQWSTFIRPKDCCDYHDNCEECPMIESDRCKHKII